MIAGSGSADAAMPADQILRAADRMARPDEIRWVPWWMSEPTIDRANILGMDDAELLAYALDLQRQYRSLRELCAVAVENLSHRTQLHARTGPRL